MDDDSKVVITVPDKVLGHERSYTYTHGQLELLATGGSNPRDLPTSVLRHIIHAWLHGVVERNHGD